VTQCKNCPGKKGICHVGCIFGNGEDKQRCCVMAKKGGICIVCGCHWQDHVNSDFVYETNQVKKVYDIEEIKQQNKKATEGLTNSQVLITALCDS